MDQVKGCLICWMPGHRRKNGGKTRRVPPSLEEVGRTPSPIRRDAIISSSPSGKRRSSDRSSTPSSSPRDGALSTTSPPPNDRRFSEEHRNRLYNNGRIISASVPSTPIHSPTQTFRPSNPAEPVTPRRPADTPRPARGPLPLGSTAGKATTFPEGDDESDYIPLVECISGKVADDLPNSPPPPPPVKSRQLRATRLSPPRDSHLLGLVIPPPTWSISNARRAGCRNTEIPFSYSSHISLEELNYRIQMQCGSHYPDFTAHPARLEQSREYDDRGSFSSSGFLEESEELFASATATYGSPSYQKQRLTELVNSRQSLWHTPCQSPGECGPDGGYPRWPNIAVRRQSIDEVEEEDSYMPMNGGSGTPLSAEHSRQIPAARSRAVSLTPTQQSRSAYAQSHPFFHVLPSPLFAANPMSPSVYIGRRPVALCCSTPCSPSSHPQSLHWNGGERNGPILLVSGGAERHSPGDIKVVPVPRRPHLPEPCSLKDMDAYEDLPPTSPPPLPPSAPELPPPPVRRTPSPPSRVFASGNSVTLPPRSGAVVPGGINAVPPGAEEGNMLSPDEDDVTCDGEMETICSDLKSGEELTAESNASTSPSTLESTATSMPTITTTETAATSVTDNVNHATTITVLQSDNISNTITNVHQTEKSSNHSNDLKVSNVLSNDQAQATRSQNGLSNGHPQATRSQNGPSNGHLQAPRSQNGLSNGHAQASMSQNGLSNGYALPVQPNLLYAVPITAELASKDKKFHRYINDPSASITIDSSSRASAVSIGSPSGSRRYLERRPTDPASGSRTTSSSTMSPKEDYYNILETIYPRHDTVGQPVRSTQQFLVNGQNRCKTLPNFNNNSYNSQSRMQAGERLQRRGTRNDDNDDAASLSDGSRHDNDDVDYSETCERCNSSRGRRSSNSCNGTSSQVTSNGGCAHRSSTLRLAFKVPPASHGTHEHHKDEQKLNYLDLDFPQSTDGEGQENCARKGSGGGSGSLPRGTGGVGGRTMQGKGTVDYNELDEVKTQALSLTKQQRAAENVIKN